MWGYFSFLRSGHVWDVSFRQGRASLQCTESRTTQPGLPSPPRQLWILKVPSPAFTKLVSLTDKLLPGC